MIKVTNKKVIECRDWDDLVKQTYGRIYNFQQQDGCQSRGVVNITIPSEYTADDEMYDNIPEVVNGSQMGVKFASWLARDPKQPIVGQTDNYELSLFWERNFYPDLYTVANDLYKRGLIEAGDYVINIDW